MSSCYYLPIEEPISCIFYWRFYISFMLSALSISIETELCEYYIWELCENLCEY